LDAVAAAPASFGWFIELIERYQRGTRGVAEQRPPSRERDRFADQREWFDRIVKEFAFLETPEDPSVVGGGQAAGERGHGPPAAGELAESFRGSAAGFSASIIDEIFAASASASPFYTLVDEQCP
jgi:hypothetical protein